MKLKIYITLPIFLIIFLFYIISLKSVLDNENELLKAHNTSNGNYFLVPVLLFHDIDGNGPYSVTREEFRNYLNIIKEENIQIVSLKTLYHHAVNNLFFDKPTMVITIDDNYVNIVRVLAPILREYGYPATFFFYTKDIYLNPQQGTSWEDLKRLLNEGFDIQNHSYSHTAFYKKMPGDSLIEYEKKLYKEILESKQILEKYLNHTIWAFAYPMGYYTEELHHYLFNNSYKVVLTTDGRPVNLSKPFNGVIHRYTIQKKYVNDPIKMFYLQVHLAKRVYNQNDISMNEP